METMRTITRWSLALLAACGMTFTALHTASADQPCREVDSTSAGALTGATPLGFTTASELTGGGWLKGTTTADVVLTSLDPATGIATYVGTFVLITKRGTLTLDLIDGWFDTVNGLFSNGTVVVDGTDRFEGWTGELYFHGYVLPDGIQFVNDEITGELCRPEGADDE
jgi:hypothetical protein